MGGKLPKELIEEYDGRATYQIMVRGRVDSNFIKNTTDVEISHQEIGDVTYSNLYGEFQDQEALSGLLYVLIDNRYTVISVTRVDL